MIMVMMMAIRMAIRMMMMMIVIRMKIRMRLTMMMIEPYVLEFLKIPEHYHISEAELESRLIDGNLHGKKEGPLPIEVLCPIPGIA